MGTTVVPTEGHTVAGRPRQAYLDNLKAVLVAGVIVGHVCITYADIGSWAYREPSGNDAFLIPAALFVALGSLFAMGLFFLIAGLLTPRALARKGPAGFLRDRVRRLGVPFVVYLLLIYPSVEWMGHRGNPSLGWYLQEQLDRLDPGPLWFVQVLFLFSAGYAAWRAARPVREPPREMRWAHLVAGTGALALATFVVRLQFPVNSNHFLELHVWQWPQCLGLFVLGTACAENGWLDPVPVRLRRAAGLTAPVGLCVTTAGFAIGHDSFDDFAGGVSWQAVLVAGCEALIAMGLSIWLLGHFQRRHDRGGPLARGAGRAAFGAYVLQAPVVVGIAVLAGRLPAAPEVKFLVVAPTAVLGSFGLAWLLSRIPGMNRVL
jgi:surface polysaccharide O-acyltransferase-like enzyme